MADVRRHVVAIHQPNFFPWLGYFDKIARADTFVFLDDAQFQKTGGTWSNRVRLSIGGEPAWTTMPIRRDYHGVVPVNAIVIDNGQRWRDKLVKTLQACYARAAFFQTVFPLVERLCANPTDSLADYNISAIRSIAEAIGLDTSRFVRSSSLDISARATDRLIAIVGAVGGTAYLAGGGSAGYQDDQQFASTGVDLLYQSFRHPVYRQGPGQAFVQGLSCLDALLHCGCEGTAALLAQDRITAGPSHGTCA